MQYHESALAVHKKKKYVGVRLKGPASMSLSVKIFFKMYDTLHFQPINSM